MGISAEIIELKKTIAVGKEIVKQENRGCFECPLLKAAPVFVQYRFCRRSFLVCCREIISLGGKMEEIAGYPLEYRPTNSEFVDMIAFYLGDEKESKVPDVECQNSSSGKIMENLF